MYARRIPYRFSVQTLALVIIIVLAFFLELYIYIYIFLILNIVIFSNVTKQDFQQAKLILLITGGT